MAQSWGFRPYPACFRCRLGSFTELEFSDCVCQEASVPGPDGQVLCCMDLLQGGKSNLPCNLHLCYPRKGKKCPPTPKVCGHHTNGRLFRSALPSPRYLGWEHVCGRKGEWLRTGIFKVLDPQRRLSRTRTKSSLLWPPLALCPIGDSSDLSL